MKKKFIRFLTLVMSLCLLIPQAPWMSANAEETKTVFETLTNGSFEIVENGMPTAWTANGTNDSDTVTLQDRGKALWLNNQGSTSPAVYQLVSGLTGSSVSEDGTTVTQEVTYTITAKIMVTTSTAKPVFDLRGNSKTSGKAGYNYRQVPTVSFSAVPGVWQDVTVTYKAPTDLTQMDLRLINQGVGVVYFDDIVMYRTDDEAKTNLIQNGSFDADLENWTYFTTGTPGTLYNTVNMATDGTNAMLFTGTAENSSVAMEQTVAVTAGEKYTYFASAKALDGSTGTPFLTVTHYDASGNVVGEVQNGDCTQVSSGTWVNVQATYTVPENAVTAVVSVGQTGIGNCMWDHVRFEQGEFSVEQEKDPLTIANEFRQMLAEEKNSATPVYEEPWGDSDTYDQPYAGQTNLLKNGDFEQNSGSDSDELAFWTLKEEFGEYISLAEGEGVNGSDCIKFCVPESAGMQNPFYSQWVNVVGGAEYQISYKYKIVTTNDSAATANPTVKVECWSGKDLAGASYIAGYYVHGARSNNDGQWYTKTQKVYPGSNVTDMEFLARWLAAGTNIGDSTVIYIDDVEIFMTRPPKPMDLVTDAVFYYTDVAVAEGATGTITTKINTGYYPTFFDAKVELVIFDENKNQIWPAADSSKAHTSVNGVVSVNFPLSVLTEKETRYEVVATLYDTDGTTMKQRNVQNIFVYDRPTSLAANGVFTKDNGEIFYPEYAYHVGNYPKIAAESGINLVQMGAFGSPESALKALDNAQAQGIMGFIALYNNMLPAGNDANINNTVAIIEAVKDHPALYGYGVMDEVYLHFSNPEPDMEASYRLIRSLDPKHPVMTMEAVQSFYDECEKFVDVLCIDPYSTAASQHVADSVTAALDAVNYKKPVYALLEAYRNTHGRFPTPNDLRNNIWQALIKGASAVGYYSIIDAEINPDTGKYSIPIWDANDGGALWQAICDFKAYEKQLAYDHFVFGKTPVYHESAQSGAPYWYSSWYDGEDMYMVVLSMLEDAQATQNVNIPLNKDGDAAFGGFSAVAVSGRIDENGVGESLHGTDNLALTLQGWEAVLYKISKTDESLCTFGDYTSNNDASCLADGTKSAVCPICGEIDTVPDASSKLDHQFGDYVSDGNGKAVATCQRGCTATHEVDDVPSISQNSISLKGNVGVNYYTIIPTSVQEDENATIHFTMADGEVIKIPIEDGEKKVRNGITYYSFTCQASAKEMGDEIKAQIFYGDGKSTEENTYSVKKYADFMLSNAAYEDYQPLIKAMLRYGALAQKQFAYKTNALVADLTDIDLSAVTVDTLEGFKNVGTGTAKAKFYGTSLLLKSETTLRFFFQVDADANLKVTYGGTELKVKDRNGLKYVDVKNISAKDLDKAVTLTVSDGVNTAEVTACPLGYCYDVLAAGDTYTEPLLSLVKALYQYHVEAKRMLG